MDVKTAAQDLRYRGFLLVESRSLGATSHWHCHELKLYGVPTREMLESEIEGKIQEKGALVAEAKVS